jgi:hypothetical protein
LGDGNGIEIIGEERIYFLSTINHKFSILFILGFDHLQLRRIKRSESIEWTIADEIFQSSDCFLQSHPLPSRRTESLFVIRHSGSIMMLQAEKPPVVSGNTLADRARTAIAVAVEKLSDGDKVFQRL